MAANGWRYLNYWRAQLAGWSLYCAMIVYINYINRTLDLGLLRVLVLLVAVGIGVSHTFRAVILRYGWLQLSIGAVLLRLLFSSLVLGGLAFILQASVNDVVFTDQTPMLTDDMLDIVNMVLNWSALLLLWSLGYFGHHYFIRSRQEELRNLRLETAYREGQLSNLRAQMNPHFMFNALNGIRALIDEDPVRAKKAITELSAILRNAMNSVKRRTVPLGEELDIVRSYLALETMRYEERLRVEFDVEKGLERVPFPPMLLQTLVENGVRHGIATLQEGGDISITVKREGDKLRVTISNSGSYRPGSSRTNGIGLRNTRKRLEMLYGKKAGLSISEKDGKVITQVEIPQNTGDENIDSR